MCDKVGDPPKNNTARNVPFYFRLASVGSTRLQTAIQGNGKLGRGQVAHKRHPGIFSLSCHSRPSTLKTKYKQIDK